MMHETKACQIELSKYTWQLKQSGAGYEILEDPWTSSQLQQHIEAMQSLPDEEPVDHQNGQVHAAKQEIGSCIQM